MIQRCYANSQFQQAWESNWHAVIARLGNDKSTVHAEARPGLVHPAISSRTDGRCSRFREIPQWHEPRLSGRWVTCSHSHQDAAADADPSKDGLHPLVQDWEFT